MEKNVWEIHPRNPKKDSELGLFYLEFDIGRYPIGAAYIATGFSRFLAIPLTEFLRLEGVIQEVEEIDKWLNRQENPPKIIKDETINKSSHADHYLGRPVEYVGIANRVTIYSPLINDKREYKSIEIFSGKDISDTLGMKFVDSFSRTEILHGKVMRLSL